jgi:hypothetical protein
MSLGVGGNFLSLADAGLSIMSAFDERVARNIVVTDRGQELCEGTIVAGLIWLQIMD